MRLKFYLDEDSADTGLVPALRARGFEVALSADSGLLGADDRTQLEWCAAQGFVMVTHNVGDFFELHGVLFTRDRDFLHIGATWQRVAKSDRMGYRSDLTSQPATVFGNLDSLQDRGMFDT